MDSNLSIGKDNSGAGGGGNSLIKFAIQLHPELKDENKSSDKVLS